MLLKVDCEGSEYKILSSFDSKIWSSIETILMEVHGENYQELLDLLGNHEFKIFSINHRKDRLFDHICDVYATR